MNERTRPVVAVAIVVVLVAAVGGWWWSQRDNAIRLGDYGQVTAVVDGCHNLLIEADGLQVGGALDPLETLGREGREIVGHLQITDRLEADGQQGVEGLFTADDGTEVAVHGGLIGEYRLLQTCSSPGGPGGI